MIVLRKAGETPTTITLEWDPVAGASGYRFQSAGTAPKWSHTWDGTRTTVRFAKGQEPYRVEALGALDAGVYPAPAVPTGRLKWAPPVLANPTTITVTNANRAFGENAAPLPRDRDYIFRLAEPITAGTVQIVGGRHVVIVGGEINLDGKEKPCGSFVNNNVIGLQLGAQAGICHLEGLHIHGRGMAQGIVFWAVAGTYTTTLRLQNCRIEALEKVATSGAHTDAIQLYAGPNRLELFQNTIVSRGPCLQLQTYDLAADAMPTPEMHWFERTNCRQLDQSGNCPDPPPYHRAWFLTKNLKGASSSQKPWPQHNQDFWLDEINGQDYNAGGTSGDAKAAGWNPPGASGYVVTGEPIRLGTPPGGDFVPAGVAGVGYTSPGYV